MVLELNPHKEHSPIAQGVDLKPKEIKGHNPRIKDVSSDTLKGRIDQSNDESPRPLKGRIQPAKKEEPKKEEILSEIDEEVDSLYRDWQGLTDEEFAQKLQQEEEIKDQGIGSEDGDCWTEEQFQKWKEQSKKKEAEIENLTVSIMIHLQTLADGKARKDLEEAFEPHINESDFETTETIERNDYFAGSRLNPFRQDTNFDEQDYMKRPSSTLKSVNQMISALATILFGVELFKPEDKDTRSFAQMEEDLQKDRDNWEHSLAKHYKDYFDRNIHETFSKAQFLINERKTSSVWMQRYRIGFYATTSCGGIGIFLGKNIIWMVSLAASAITFIFMLIHYGSSSFKQSILAAELKSSGAFLEKIGAANRLPIPFDIPAELDT